MKDEKLLPRYRCHKTVHALKIKNMVVRGNPDEITLEFEGDWEPLAMPREWCDKHDVAPDGYLVIYEDGYKSWSPAEVFERWCTLEEIAPPEKASVDDSLMTLFMYHAPKPEQVPKYEALRAKAYELARMIDDLVPAGSDRTAAVRHLRECVMTANAGIACRGVNYR